MLESYGGEVMVTRKVIVYFSDGASNAPGITQEDITKISNAEIATISIGVGDATSDSAYQQEIEMIAGEKSQSFLISDFSGLAVAENLVNEMICSSVTPLPQSDLVTAGSGYVHEINPLLPTVAKMDLGNYFWLGINEVSFEIECAGDTSLTLSCQNDFTSSNPAYQEEGTSYIIDASLDQLGCLSAANTYIYFQIDSLTEQRDLCNLKVYQTGDDTARREAEEESDVIYQEQLIAQGIEIKPPQGGFTFYEFFRSTPLLGVALAITQLLVSEPVAFAFMYLSYTFYGSYMRSAGAISVSVLGVSWSLDLGTKLLYL